MKRLLQVEEVALFSLGVLSFSYLDYSWWWFFGLLLVPDLSMLGYLFNVRWGAWCYNLFHHRALAITLGIIGFYSDSRITLLVSCVLFSHASLDRIFGYGFKYENGFKFTHLGKIGKL